jgi:hypothetical protein
MTRALKKLDTASLPAGAQLALIALDDIARATCSRMMFMLVPTIKRTIRVRKGAIHEAVLGGVQPKAIIYWLIIEFGGDMLSSGTLHLHRGVLTDHGHQLYAIWNDAIDQMVHLKRLDENAAAIRRTEMDQAIRRMGHVLRQFNLLP